MGDTGRQMTNGFHLLGLGQLFLQKFAFGHIGADDQSPHIEQGAIPERYHRQAQFGFFTVGSMATQTIDAHRLGCLATRV